MTVPGLTTASPQGDVAIVELLDAMGCVVVSDDSGTTDRRAIPARPLIGIDVDMADVSDLVPTVAAVAVTATTPTTIRGVGFIRAKESDRLGDLAAELRKTGAAVDATDDGLHIEPVAELHGATLATHHDHRLAMAFAVLGSVGRRHRGRRPGRRDRRAGPVSGPPTTRCSPTTPNAMRSRPWTPTTSIADEIGFGVAGRR